MNELIGRTRECAELAQCVASDRSELVIVYGRRVGKTVVNTFVTTYGVANGKYSSIVHSNVVLDDLF